MLHTGDMLYRLADRSNMQMRVRVIDLVVVTLWLTAIALLAIGTLMDLGGHIGRWGLLVGMMALATTMWAIATWMVEVIRLEYEITTLRRLPRKRAANGDE